ncbi:transcriptional repressor [Carnobacteriaceae bacterium zg-ZUI252]|nr:transcriptional repressor [Carnobacteriaceae bacterium zg-ZUI252]MBS4770283.1 transcriptional repressor [Carnobacteriaceae bacterium zg-ZUI240]QTU82429.1 transcriptional repressor [Carnobacteriaceae bacterium zg-C25]
MDIVQEAIAKMKEQGYKQTPKRQAMLEVIANSEKFVSAKQVQEALKSRFKGLSYDTVYRNLYTFVEQGILEMSERNGEKIFIMHHSHHHHHHHFICNVCDRITELEHCPMDVFAQQLPDYVILGHRFEITGICKECLENQEFLAEQYESHDEHCHCGAHHS